MTTYEPPLVAIGSPMNEALDEIGPGVRGYAVESNGRIYIPLIEAIAPGNGDVGRFLDSLSPRCAIANAASERLAGMLIRRGWVETIEESHDGPCDVWVKTKEAP